jgi:hypothetical protein
VRRGGGATVSAVDDGAEEQHAIERVAKARKRLDAARSVYGPPAKHKVVTQADLDEIAAAESELEAAIADKNRVLDEIRAGKRR